MCGTVRGTRPRTRIWLLAGLLVLVSAASASSGVSRVVFVTSVTGTGDLGSWPDAGGNIGVSAGDAICQACGSSRTR